MHGANTTAETRCLALEAELANLRETNNQDNQTELITHFSKLEVSHLNLQLKYQDLKDQIGSSPPTPDEDTPDFDSVFVIGKMQASLQGKDNAIRQLKKELSKLQVTHQDTDRALRVQTTDSQITKKKQVIVAQSSNKLDSTTHPHVVTVTSQKINIPVPPSTGVDCCPIASESQPLNHVKPNRISPAKDKTVDVNAPSDQTPTMDPPEYQENVAKHRGFLAGETRSTQDLPASKPAKPARKPQSTAQKAPPKPSISSPVTSTQPAPTSVPAKTQENKRKQATGTTDKPAKAKRIKRSVSRKTHQSRDEDADFQKAVEESMKDAYALPKGPLPPVVIREPESGKYQPLPEVPGKGKAKVEEESEKIVHGVEKGSQDEGQAGPDPNAQAKGQTGSDTGAQAEGQVGSNPEETSEGQAGSNPDETSEGQARPDPSNAEARVQSTSSPVVHAGSDREHMDIDVANVSPQPSTEPLYERFTATIYPNVQENLKLAVEEPVLLEEPASSSGTLSSLQHLSRDFTFGDQFFSDKPSDADKSAETEVESMVNVPIQQALSSISLMTSLIIDLTSRPESPKEHQQLKATTTDTTTTSTTKHDRGDDGEAYR
nr:hypothetical protein [Tanacetum cinerariifolium]